MATMPIQKPGRSEQSVGTPPDFISAVERRLGIGGFNVDLAADETNAVCYVYIDEHRDAFKQDSWNYGLGWSWLNPPYADIKPWVKRAWEESRTHRAQIAVLVPAAVGSNWWKDWVRNKAYITFLNNRIKFIGHKDVYPKDLALLLYAPFLEGGDCMWRWK